MEELRTTRSVLSSRPPTGHEMSFVVDASLPGRDAVRLAQRTAAGAQPTVHAAIEGALAAAHLMRAGRLHGAPLGRLKREKRASIEMRREEIWPVMAR